MSGMYMTELTRADVEQVYGGCSDPMCEGNIYGSSTSSGNTYAKDSYSGASFNGISGTGNWVSPTTIRL